MNFQRNTVICQATNRAVNYLFYANFQGMRNEKTIKKAIL